MDKVGLNGPSCNAMRDDPFNVLVPKLVETIVSTWTHLAVTSRNQNNIYLFIDFTYINNMLALPNCLGTSSMGENFKKESYIKKTAHLSACPLVQ